jgi:sortase A
MDQDQAPVPLPELDLESWSLRGALVGALRGPAARRLEHALFLVAALALGWCTWTLADAARYERAQSERLDHLPRRGTAARGPGPFKAEATRTEARENGLVGRLEMDRLGLSAIVSEGTGSRTLRRAVGHVPGTAFPGETGNVVLAAHRDRHFRPLRKVEEGDLVRLTTPDGTFVYRVDDARVVEPGSTDLVQPASRAPVLTLVTCYPFYFVGDAPLRFIVRASLVAPAS